MRGTSVGRLAKGNKIDALEEVSLWLIVNDISAGVSQGGQRQGFCSCGGPGGGIPPALLVEINLSVV